MRLRNWFFAAVALYFCVQVFSGLYEWHLRNALADQIGVPEALMQTCPMGQLPMSVDGQPPECMTGAQYDGRELVEKAIEQGDAPELRSVLQGACELKTAGTCEELAYLDERMQ